MPKTGDKKVMYIAQGGMIAALYTVLTIFIAAFNLASGAVQVRISEALCILPIFTPAAVPGLTVGCLLSNLITGCALPDVIFGSLATLIGAIGTRLLKEHRYLASLPPILSNTVIVPFILKYAYGLEGALYYFALTVGIGEIISCFVLGQLLITALKPIAGRIL